MRLVKIGPAHFIIAAINYRVRLPILLTAIVIAVTVGAIRAVKLR